MLYFSIQHPNEYDLEFACLLCVSKNVNDIKSSLIFKTDHDSVTIRDEDSLGFYEVYSGSYAVLQYMDGFKFRSFDMSIDATSEYYADYFDNESIKEMKECKYYIKKDGKIILEKDITDNIKNLVNA